MCPLGPFSLAWSHILSMLIFYISIIRSFALFGKFCAKTGMAMSEQILYAFLVQYEIIIITDTKTLYSKIIFMLNSRAKLYCILTSTCLPDNFTELRVVRI